MFIPEIESPDKEQWIQDRVNQILHDYRDGKDLEDVLDSKKCAELEYEMNFNLYKMNLLQK